MKINYLVIHELKKEPNQKNARVELSSTLPSMSDSSIALVEQLNEKYRYNEKYAIFNKKNRTLFSDQYAEFHKSSNAENFLQFTQSTLLTLQKSIENISQAKGGFFVFADYQTAHSDFCSVFLIRDKSGLLFEKDKQSSAFEVKPTTHLDLDKLAMGCKINKRKYSQRQHNYLSFLETRLQELSAYFIDWIGAEKLEDNKQYTTNLYEIINHIDRPIQDNKKITREEFKKQVYHYWKNQPSKTISLIELGKQFYGEENKTILIEYAHKNQLVIDSDFKPDAKEMSKFYKIHVVGDSITLSFDYGALNKNLILDPKQDDTIIIRSQELYYKIKEKLKTTSTHDE